MAHHDNLVHAIEIPALLPPSPRTGRVYTSASIYRWFSIGRLTAVQVSTDRGIYAFRTDVERLAKKMTSEAQEAVA